MKGNGEAPADWGGATVDEGEAAGALSVKNIGRGLERANNSSQYATTTPKMLSVNSMAMNWPRLVCCTLSVAQTGTMAFSIPVPNPLIKRALQQSVKKTSHIPNKTYQKSSKYDSAPNIADWPQKSPTQPPEQSS